MNLAKPLQAKSGYSTGTAINQLPGNGLPAIGFMIKQRALISASDTLKNYAYLADHAYLGVVFLAAKADWGRNPPVLIIVRPNAPVRGRFPLDADAGLDSSIGVLLMNAAKCASGFIISVKSLLVSFL